MSYLWPGVEFVLKVHITLTVNLMLFYCRWITPFYMNRYEYLKLPLKRKVHVLAPDLTISLPFWSVIFTLLSTAGTG